MGLREGSLGDEEALEASISKEMSVPSTEGWAVWMSGKTEFEKR